MSGKCERELDFGGDVFAVTKGQVNNRSIQVREVARPLFLTTFFYLMPNFETEVNYDNF